MGGNGMTKEKKPKKFLDGAVIYCLLMCTLIDVAVIILYWHSQTAPDSLGIAAMAAPWAIEFGAAAKIKLGKQPYNKSNPLNDERGE